MAGDIHDTPAVIQQPQSVPLPFLYQGTGGTGVLIRNLQDTPEDAEFAGKLTVEAFLGKFTHAVGARNIPTMKRNLARSHRGQSPRFYQRSFVAEYEGRRAGFMALKFHKDKEPDDDDIISGLGCCAACGLIRLGCCTDESVKRGECYLDHICVDEAFRGKGVGGTLMEKADAEAVQHGCRVIYLYVVEDNRAKNLYERKGYHVTDHSTCCGFLRCFIGEKGVYQMKKNL